MSLRWAGRMPAQRPTKEDQLEKRTIGSLEVSVVGLGCNNFGWRIDAAATARVVDSALDAGINFLDTADIYGNGQSEEFLGHALKGRWDRVVIATKFGSKSDDQRQGAKPDYIRRAVEDSLRRLGTERIDLYQLHRPDGAQRPTAFDGAAQLNEGAAWPAPAVRPLEQRRTSGGNGGVDGSNTGPLE